VLRTDDSGRSWETDGVVPTSPNGVEMVATESWIVGEIGNVFYRAGEDPAWTEYELHTEAGRFEAVEVSDDGVIYRLHDARVLDPPRRSPET